jgi:high-affinity nickel-transport protein
VDPTVSAVVLGFVLGLQHATDPDHLVAVATIATRERRFAAGAVIGALWGLGHTATLALAGSVILALDLTRDVALASGFEAIVAAMLIALGAWRLVEVARGLRALPRQHVRLAHVADHEHGRLEVFHSHAHAHGDGVHDHPHLHPSKRLSRALGRNGRHTWAAPMLIGAVHGMAGSAAISLVVFGTVRAVAGATAYLGLFGLGTVCGMTALTAAMAYPVALAAPFERARTALAVAAGLGSIAFGVAYGYRVL